MNSGRTCGNRELYRALASHCMRHKTIVACYKYKTVAGHCFSCRISQWTMEADWDGPSSNMESLPQSYFIAIGLARIWSWRLHTEKDPYSKFRAERWNTGCDIIKLRMAAFFNQSYSAGWMTSSIFKIILQTWVARKSCCFLLLRDSNTFWVFMSLVPASLQSMPRWGLLSDSWRLFTYSTMLISATLYGFTPLTL